MPLSSEEQNFFSFLFYFRLIFSIGYYENVVFWTAYGRRGVSYTGEDARRIGEVFFCGASLPGLRINIVEQLVKPPGFVCGGGRRR